MSTAKGWLLFITIVGLCVLATYLYWGHSTCGTYGSKNFKDLCNQTK
jgi:hypothetical protein